MPNQTVSPRGSLLVSLLLLSVGSGSVTPGIASAAEATPVRGDEVPVDVKLRVSVPMMAWHIPNDRDQGDVDLVDGFALVGLAARIDLWRLLAIEAGFQWFAFMDHLIADAEPAYDLSLQAGALPTLLDTRGPDGNGWQLQAGGLAGYRFVQFAVNLFERDSVEEESHCLTASAGLESTYWSAAGAGFNLMLQVGAYVPVAQWHNRKWRSSSDAPADTEWGVLLDLSAGVAF